MLAEMLYEQVLVIHVLLIPHLDCRAMLVDPDPVAYLHPSVNHLNRHSIL